MAHNKELDREVSRQTLERLLKVHGEGDHLDFKQIFSLSSQRQKSEMVRDMLAFANTEGGGHIIYGVTDKDFTPIGLPPTDSVAESDCHLDTTKIYQALKNTCPPIFNSWQQNTSYNCLSGLRKDALASSISPSIQV